MKRYRNLHGDSGVVAYALAPDAISVRFVDGHTYLYNHDRPGAEKVARMTQLALSGAGLSSYISRHVRDDYAAKS
jgi:hypothetical protein